jgi:prephenate dehydrogenase
MPVVTDDNAPTAQPLSQLRVGIAGLGLMGGSLALALRGQVRSLHGLDRNAATRWRALREGVVDSAEATLTAASPPLDLLVLALPVRAIVEWLARLPDLRPAGCGVIDLGSTKRAVVAAMSTLPERFEAIGGHPLCGKETSGLAAAAADLYQEQRFVLCPTMRTTKAIRDRALALIEAIGARPITLDAGHHDAILAATSHLPYVISATLMRSVVEERQWSLSASGFRDVSRLAGGEPQVMLDILLTNRDELLATLARYRADLDFFQEALERGDERALAGWIATARSAHAAHAAHRRRGSIA